MGEMITTMLNNNDCLVVHRVRSATAITGKLPAADVLGKITHYKLPVLDEASRRGARMAAVCPVNDPAISQAAAFNNAMIPDLDAGDIVVEYLDGAGANVGAPGTAAGFRLIRYVRVRVVGYQHQMFIPFVTALGPFFMPEFAAVLPRESLGIPRTGVITPC